jgi:hypothetical protein
MGWTGRKERLSRRLGDFYGFGMLTEDDARDLANYSALAWDDADRELLAPLVDAAFVCAEELEFERVGWPMVEALWADGLADAIEEAVAHGPSAELLEAARADLAQGPRESKLGRAYVEQGASQLAFEEQMPICCLLCVEERLGRTDAAERPEVARQVARIAIRAAGVPEDELRAAVALAAVGGPSTALAVATDERRRAVRAWLGRLAELGVKTAPNLSAELRALVAGPLPVVEADDVWPETVAGLSEAVGHP